MRAVHTYHDDLQRMAPLGFCTRCGGELYPRQPHWRVGGQLLCRTCAAQWALEVLAPYRVDGEEARP